MKFFGLQAGVGPPPGAKAPALAFAMVYGGLSFGVVSLLAY